MTKEIWVTSTPEIAATVADAISAVNAHQDAWRLFAKRLPEKLRSDKSAVDAQDAAVEVAQWAGRVPSVYVTHQPFTDHWFSHHYARSAVISTNGISELELGFPEVAYLAYELAQALGGFSLGEGEDELLSLCHDPAVGCLFDLCSYKPDIRQGMAAGRLCSRCAAALRALGMSAHALQSISQLLQYVSRQGSISKGLASMGAGDGMLSILHLSDLHFGAAFRFAPAILRPGQPPVLEPFGNLTDPCHLVLSDLERMSEDLDLPPEIRRLAARVDVVVLSGDTANTGGRDSAGPLRENGPEDEFDQAAEFVGSLLSGIREWRSKADATYALTPCVVAVPGNHDVDWSADASSRQRFLGYARFWHAVSGSADYLNRDPNDIVCYRQVATDEGAVVVMGFNSCTMSAQQENLRDIGIVENAQLDLADRLLHAANDAPVRKIAVVHHHPICMPPVAAEYATYDAIAQAGRFLSYLQDRGFDLVIHGHKHYPMAWVHNMRPYEAGRMQNWSDPVMVSGGSLSAQPGCLPQGIPNAYHLIGLRIVPDALWPKCVVLRRALPLGELLHGVGFHEDGIWHLGADRPAGGRRQRTSGATSWGAGTPDGTRRSDIYAASDGWMLVHRYRRSREPDQLFDISIYLTAHKKAGGGRKKVRAVTYDVGRLWPSSPFVVDDPKNGFELRLSAYGPFLCLVSVEFEDGTSCSLERYVDFEMSDLVPE